MESKRIAGWITIGANLAILAGLIFVAVQIRHRRCGNICYGSGIEHHI
jgi:hypothetical protein